MDWVTGAANLINGLIRTHRANEWVKLLVQLVASDLLSWQFTEGAALVAHTEALVARGSGLVCGAVCAVIVWRRSPLTRGLMLAMPEKEAEVELSTNTQTISK